MQCFIFTSLIYIMHLITIQTTEELDVNFKTLILKFIHEHVYQHVMIAIYG